MKPRNHLGLQYMAKYANRGDRSHRPSRGLAGPVSASDQFALVTLLLLLRLMVRPCPPYLRRCNAGTSEIETLLILSN
jgi:hypothetical protein